MKKRGGKIPGIGRRQAPRETSADTFARLLRKRGKTIAQKFDIQPRVKDSEKSGSR